MKCKSSFLAILKILIILAFSKASAVQILSSDQPLDFPAEMESESLWSDLYSRFHSANEKINLQDYYKRNQCEVVNEDEPFYFYFLKTYWIQISTRPMKRPKNWFKALFESQEFFENVDLYVEEEMRHHSGVLTPKLYYFIGPKDYKVRIADLNFVENDFFEIYLKSDRHFRYILTTLKRGNSLTRKIFKC